MFKSNKEFPKIKFLFFIIFLIEINEAMHRNRKGKMIESTEEVNLLCNEKSEDFEENIEENESYKEKSSLRNSSSFPFTKKEGKGINEAMLRGKDKVKKVKRNEPIELNLLFDEKLDFEEYIEENKNHKKKSSLGNSSSFPFTKEGKVDLDNYFDIENQLTLEKQNAIREKIKSRKHEQEEIIQKNKERNYFNNY